MKKSKSMINESSNVYSGDDEGFESSPEKVFLRTKSILHLLAYELIVRWYVVKPAVDAEEIDFWWKYVWILRCMFLIPWNTKTACQVSYLEMYFK